MYDYLIQNANILDGSGAPAYPGDVAISSGRDIWQSFKPLMLSMPPADI